MIEIIERVDHKYDNEEEGETFTLVWRHIKLVGELVNRARIIKELFLPPDSKLILYPLVQDGYNHYIISGWWGR